MSLTFKGFLKLKILFLNQWCFVFRKMVPGCGLGLIELGYGMADEVQGVQGSELVKLYKVNITSSSI